MRSVTVRSSNTPAGVMRVTQRIPQSVIGSENPLVRGLMYSRTQNENGTYNTRCLYCFMTVASDVESDEELARVEVRQCLPWNTSWPSLQAQKRREFTCCASINRSSARDWARRPARWSQAGAGGHSRSCGTDLHPPPCSACSPCRIQSSPHPSRLTEKYGASSKPPVHIDVVIFQFGRSLKLAQRFVVAAGIRVDDAEVEAGQPQRGTQFDRFLQQRTCVLRLVQLQIGISQVETWTDTACAGSLASSAWNSVAASGYCFWVQSRYPNPK